MVSGREHSLSEWQSFLSMREGRMIFRELSLRDIRLPVSWRNRLCPGGDVVSVRGDDGSGYRGIMLRCVIKYVRLSIRGLS